MSNTLIFIEKIKYLQVEILSLKLKDFINKNNKEELTIHNIYKKFKR